MNVDPRYRPDESDQSEHAEAAEKAAEPAFHTPWWAWSRVQAALRNEVEHLTRLNRSDRSWQLPLAAGLSSGLPLMVGAYFGRLDFGLVSALGGLVFLYVTATPLAHRMVLLMACAFGLAACYALGLISHFSPALLAVSLALIAMLVTMVCRVYALGPPGSLFFIMAASIGAYMPVQVPDVPLYVGLMTMGSLLACLIALLYSVATLELTPPKPPPPRSWPAVDQVLVDGVVLAAFVAMSVLVAHALDLSRAYWVPVSCVAVMQGATLRAVWNKQVQRIVGTALGLLLAWGVLTLPLNPWLVAALVMALSFLIEVFVVRHYGIAMVFITPLTLLLAEAAHLGASSSAALIQSRFIDIVLGSVIGLIGGACLHHAGLRTAVGGWIAVLLPRRARPSAD